ncbi:MAG: hypothetical protein FJX80_12315 [Bacteroidetes bacterium]|nr:hypothetical protein [Bacteroidota bacterium]
MSNYNPTIRHTTYFTLIIGTLTITLFSCGSGKDESTVDITEKVAQELKEEEKMAEDATKEEASVVEETVKISDNKTEGLSTEFLGNYHGIQPSYFMKNQYGDDAVINGNKIPIPSSDYKFLLKENNVVRLQQINLENNSRYYYEGTYRIISNESNTIKVECSLSDGQYSKPTYILTINKNDKKGICNHKSEPELSIEKIK